MHLSEMILATAKSVSTAGITIQLDGDSAPLNKRYKSIATGATINANDRVLVLKISGTYIVIGKLTGG